MGASKLWQSAQRLFSRCQSGLGAGLDLLFVPECAVCRGELEQLGLCPACRSRLFPPWGPLCRQCAAPVPSHDAHRGDCVRCRKRDFHFDSAIALGEYTGLLRETVLRLKRPRQEALARALADLLSDQLATPSGGQHNRQDPPDVICPVPMHWTRRLVRGVNSPDLLAEQVAQRLGIPFAPGLLVSRRKLRRQASLSQTERFRNVRHAFSLGGGYVLKSARVLLIDDILTTGATCSEAARTLKRAGATTVAVAVLGRAQSEV